MSDWVLLQTLCECKNMTKWLSKEHYLGFIHGGLPFQGDKFLYKVERGVLFSLEPLNMKRQEVSA